MNKMKRFIFFMVLGFICFQGLYAKDIDSSKAILERILTSHGVTLTIGEGWDNFGFGINIFRTLLFLDGEDMNGLYLMLFMTIPTVRIIDPGGVKINDLRVAGIGYRGKTFIKNLGFSTSISAAFGQRRIENMVYGDFYWGIAPELGLYFPHNAPIDFEIILAPMIHIYNLGGQDVTNKSYLDVHFLINFKEFFKKSQYPWTTEESTSHH